MSLDSYNTCLSANKIRLSVRLGYEKEEREVPQWIEVDIKLFFKDLPSASYNDSDDFVCYDTMSRLILKLCEDREFRLIEYLGKQIYDTIRPDIPQDIKILIKLTKCKLLVDFVTGGASFSYTDLPPFSWVVPE